MQLGAGKVLELEKNPDDSSGKTFFYSKAVFAGTNLMQRIKKKIRPSRNKITSRFREKRSEY